MRRMRAGLLKEDITIKTSQIETNSFGEETESWVVKYKTKARLVHDGGTRMLDNSEIWYSATKTFEVRMYVPIDEYDHIVWKGKEYRILNIEPMDAQWKKIIKTELIND